MTVCLATNPAANSSGHTRWSRMLTTTLQRLRGCRFGLATDLTVGGRSGLLAREHVARLYLPLHAVRKAQCDAMAYGEWVARPVRRDAHPPRFAGSENAGSRARVV